jgi:ABC-type multidrug transport system permease subunit
MTVEGASYLNFVIPGIIALTAMTASFSGVGMKLNVDRLFYGCFDECRMSPISPLSLVVGKAMIGVVRGLMSSIAFLIIGFIIAPALQINVLFFMVLILTCFVFSFLGVLASFLAKSHADMSTFSSLILLPMTFLGGTFFSLDQVPVALKVFLYLIPLTHTSQCLRSITLAQPFPGVSLLVLIGYGLVFFWACMFVLKRISV